MRIEKFRLIVNYQKVLEFISTNYYIVMVQIRYWKFLLSGDNHFVNNIAFVHTFWLHPLVNLHKIFLFIITFIIIRVNIIFLSIKVGEEYAGTW